MTETEIEVISFKCKRKHFYCKAEDEGEGEGQAPKQVTQRVCGVSIFGDIQNLNGHGPEQTHLADT